MKIACIYHSINLNGWMSAAIVKHWWKTLYFDYNKVYQKEEEGSLLLRGNFSNEEQERIDFIGYNYGQPIPDLSKYDKVIMCGISFPRTEMYKIAIEKELIWIDHHASAIIEMIALDKQCYEEKYKGIRDIKFAACELTFKYFFPNEQMPEIVRLLGMYDSYRHKGKDEEQRVLEFQYGARECISNYEDAYDKLIECTRVKESEYWFLRAKAIVSQILEQGRSIYQYLCTEAKQCYKNGFDICFDTHKFICINKERFNPINFGIDYHKDGYDGCACFHYANGEWNFSLYNDNGLVDCSIIAKQYGGGGHKGAAGFRVKDIKSII